MMYDVLYNICYFKRTQGYFNSYGVKKWSSIFSKRAHQLFKIPTEDNLTPHRRSELAILNFMKKPQKLIYYVMFICWPLMKLVNPQHKFCLCLTLSSAKSVIVIYIYGWWDYYIFYGSYSDIDNWGSSISEIMSHYILIQNVHTWKFCARFQWWYIQTYPENCTVQLFKARRWTWSCWIVFNLVIRKHKRVGHLGRQKITLSTMRLFSKKSSKRSF